MQQKVEMRKVESRMKPKTIYMLLKKNSNDGFRWQRNDNPIIVSYITKLINPTLFSRDIFDLNGAKHILSYILCIIFI